MTKGIFIPFNASRHHDAALRWFMYNLGHYIQEQAEAHPELNLGTPHVRKVED